MKQMLFLRSWEKNMPISHYKVILTDSAKEDLNEIYEYISFKLLENNSAKRLMKNIEKNILRLENYPYLCVEVNVKPHNEPYRKLLIGKYIALYRVNEKNKQVNIFNIVYGKKDYLQ